MIPWKTPSGSLSRLFGVIHLRQKLQIEQDKMKGSFDDDCVDLIIKEYRIRKAFMSKN
jgi:hypothetical protein